VLREAAARAEADRLRGRMEGLAQELARAGEHASRLAIAWEEVMRVLEEAASAELPGEPAKEPRPDSPADFTRRAAFAGNYVRLASKRR
jgi:hypothetical protein